MEPDTIVKEFYETVKKSVSTGKMLDLGCGQGRHALFFAEHGFEAYGVDYIERAIEEARTIAAKRKLTNIHFTLMELLKLDFSEQFFDVIVDWSVLDHVRPESWQKYVQNILKVLKVGGFLSLSEFSVKDVRVTDPNKNYMEFDGLYSHFFKEEELQSLFQESFDIVKQTESIEPGVQPRKDRSIINLLLKRKI